MADENYISFTDAAEMLGVDEDQLLNLVAGNELRAFRINREMKFKEADVQAFADKGNVGTDSVDLEDLPEDIVLMEDSESVADLPEADDAGVELMEADDAGVELMEADDAGVELMEADDAGVELMEADDAGVELMEADDAGVELLDIEGDALPESEESDDFAEEEIDLGATEPDDFDELGGSDEEISLDDDQEELKELGEVGELDFEDVAMDSDDAEATVQMTDEEDDFDSGTEPLLEAPDETDGLGTEEIIFDDDDLEIGGDDGFGIGTEEVTIQEDTLDDEVSLDEDSDDDMTMVVDEDDDDLAVDDEDDEISVDDDDDEDDAPRRSSGRRSGRSNVSSMRRRSVAPPPKTGRSSPIWAGIMVILVLSMFYPLFLFALMIWQGETDKPESQPAIVYSGRSQLENVGPILVHSWFEWFPKFEMGEKKELPKQWWGSPQNFKHDFPWKYRPAQERAAMGENTAPAPTPAPTEPVETPAPVEGGGETDAETEG